MAALGALANLADVVNDIRRSVATGSGLNLVNTVDNLLASGDATTAARILKRAGTAIGFGGKFDDVERAAVKRVAAGLSVDPMEAKLYGALGQASKKVPLVLSESNFPQQQKLHRSYRLCNGYQGLKTRACWSIGF